MRILIHSVPERMWYVEKFLIPMLKGADIIVYTDAERKGNLAAFVESLSEYCTGDGGTWHLQDDVLPSPDFMSRAAALEGDEVVCGFVNEQGGPNCNLKGRVYAADIWYSFPCIYIPNRIADEFVDWIVSGAWETEARVEAHSLYVAGRGDDWFFLEFMTVRHGADMVNNVTPCLVEHIDWLIGGSMVNVWRGFIARAAYGDFDDQVEDLKQRIKALER